MLMEKNRYYTCSRNVREATHSPSNHVSSSLSCAAPRRLHTTALPISTTGYASFFWYVFSYAVSLVSALT